MSMIDYDDLKDIEIPVEQKTMVEIMHNSYEECRDLNCVSCPDGKRKRAFNSMMSCILFKYARKLYEAGFRQTEKGAERMNNYEEEYFEDEEDFWSETPEFDEQIEEFKTALRADVKRETKELIEKLQKELDELKDYKARKSEIERKYHDEIAKMAKAEADIERKYRNKKAQEILAECCTVGWKAAWRYDKPKEKCDKCDEDGYITFYSPQGTKYREQCKCRHKDVIYYPAETRLARIYAGKSPETVRFYYKVRGDGESYSDYVRCYVVRSSDFKPEKIDSYDYCVTVFESKEDCEKCCEWLNNKEKNNE